MNDLTFWQLLGIWVGMTLVIAQAAALALVAVAVAWFLYELAF